MAYCQLIRYSKSPKQREQKTRQLMLFPVSVYVRLVPTGQLHTQADVEEVFSCSFCLRRLAMPEWWGQTIRMPRLFCFTFNLNLKPISNYYCENCGHRFADVRQILTATCSTPSRLQQPRPPQTLWRHREIQVHLQILRSHLLIYHADGRRHLCVSSKRK